MRSLLAVYYEQILKAFQALIFIGAPVTLYLAWDWRMFVAALFWGWLVVGLGAAIGFHRYATHKMFEPRNNAVKAVLLFLGTICTLGSTVVWAAGHRMHHAKTDELEDPHNPTPYLWQRIKSWFYYSPEVRAMEYIPKDLLKDKMHLWFHRNYFFVLAGYVALLGLIDPVVLGYFYCVSMLYVLTGMSWATVLAHVPSTSMGGYRLYNSDDLTYNSKFWALLFWGEGYHNTHHANPRMHCLEMIPGDFDLAGRVIKYLGTPADVTPRQFDSPRYGVAMLQECELVKQRINYWRLYAKR